MSVDICGTDIGTSGKLIRVAFLNGEGYQLLHDPEATLKCVRARKPCRRMHSRVIVRYMHASPLHQN